jgi:hypothetical protein
MTDKKVNDGGQAFPRSYAYMNPEAGTAELKSIPGMSLRAWFAGMAMQGMLASRATISVQYKLDKEWTASEAVAYADALIAELEKGK